MVEVIGQAGKPSAFKIVQRLLKYHTTNITTLRLRLSFEPTLHMLQSLLFENLTIFETNTPHAVIAPFLAQGVWVVSDRFADSTTAYQGYGRGVALQDLSLLHRIALGDLAPDLTVILDLPVEIGLARAAARSAADRFERLDRQFHEKLRQGFRQIAAENPARCILVNGSADPQTVHRAVVAAVEQRLGVGLD